MIIFVTIFYILTSSIFVTEVRKPPNIAEADSITDAGENELKFAAPVASVIHRRQIALKTVSRVWTRLASHLTTRLVQNLQYRNSYTLAIDSLTDWLIDWLIILFYFSFVFFFLKCSRDILNGVIIQYNMSYKCYHFHVITVVTSQD